MSSLNFVHLRLHSEFSILDGIVRLDDAIDAAVANQMGALALTDLGNLFGLVKFYSGARDAGVKPIAGADVWITNPEDRSKPFRGLLIVKNNLGYLHLCELLSKASLENQNLGIAEVDASWFSLPSSAQDQVAGKTKGLTLSHGLIFLSGAMAGDVGTAILAGQLDQAKECAKKWKKLFPDSFYLEVQRYGNPQEELYIRQAAQIASELKLPLVATHPVQFMKHEDFRAHEARVCIADGDQLGNPRRVRRFTDQQYFKSQDEMQALFADLPSALANSVEIAKRCNLSLVLGKPRLPDFPTPDGVTLDQFLGIEAAAGLEKRLERLYPQKEEREQERARYVQRLEFEVNTIVQMGFPGYFLIVADFINWAKNNGVPVGPGRGSGAGSLVAYSLGITDLDPLRYNLLFERFLNPERVSMPDFDIDFCQHGRDRVIQYVKDKYGADAVSQIATFGTMAAKAAIRDVGRVLEQPYPFVDGISKLIPNRPGQQITIEQAKKEEKMLADRERQEEEVRQLLELAQQLEGLTRNVGMHAGGVLIAPGKLTDFCPLYTQASKDDAGSGVISQFDKDDVEAVGLVKFDFLGLTTLTILDWAEKYIHNLYPEKKDWRVGDVPLDDPAAFEILKNANTVAVFQLESRGMQGMLKDAKPDRFEDIIALVALYRPGPMDLIPDFIARKHGRQEVEYPDQRIEPVLQETYGIMVYQEQVMQMAQIVGGYSLGGADLLRRAMGKKKPEEMAEQSKIFCEGAVKNGLTQGKAEEIFKLMEAFAGYGFNKSHAAAYALLAYHTAWLKAHYLAEFIAANLSLAMDDTEKVKILYEDALTNGLKVLPPDINEGDYRFTPLRENPNDPAMPATIVRYGLGAVRGTGENAINEIVRARADGPFKDLFDFCARVDRRVVNRRAIEALIRAGAFDAIHGGFDSRSTVLASLPRAVQSADQAAASANQVSLFDSPDHAEEHRPEFINEAVWFKKKRLQEEKLALGLCLSGHLFDAYRDEVRHFVRQPLSQFGEAAGEKLVAGIVLSIRTIMGGRGKFMAIVIDDGSAQVEMTVYEEAFDQYRSCFKEDELLIAKVQIKVTPAQENFSGSTRIICQAAMNIATARLRFAKSLHLELQSSVNLKQLKDKAKPYLLSEQINSSPVQSNLSGLVITADVISTGSTCQVQFPDSWRLYPDDNNLQGFNAVLMHAGSVKQIEVRYS
jgi:DNA polymerase-3 subunit alpha